MANESRQKGLIIGVSSLFLVAMVVAVVIGTMNTDTDSYNRQDVSSSQKAVETICAPTDYKDTCFASLKSTAENTADPKDLIEASFRSTIEYLGYAVKNSTVLQEIEKDPRTKLALKNCKELANRAIGDLEKTYYRFQDFDFSNLDQMFADLQIWISGAITYEETCLDGFEDAKGDAGEKMRQALTTAMELTSNGLAMITDISSVLSSLDVSPADLLTTTATTTGRRLLSGNNFPDWLYGESRRLLDVPLSSIQPDVIVAKDGSGKFRTINEALLAIPKKSERTFILYIKEGVYEEKVQFNSSLTHLMVIGDGPTKTRITGSLNFIDGTPTYHTATVAVLGDYFIAKDIGFENSAGAAKHQAVALRVGADKSVFYNCHMDGYQDTLYTHTYRQFYRNCEISGTIDFVFGDAAAVFQNCTFLVRKPLANQQCIVTAQGRKDVRQPTGLVLQNCSFIADPDYYPSRTISKSYLGRPWKEFSRTIIMESFIDDLIQPQGWLPWNDTFAVTTLFYTEFNNRGPGSPKLDRIKWTGVKELPVRRILRFTAARFIEAESWLPSSGVPFHLGLIFPPPKDDHVKYSPPSSQENRDLGREKQKESYVSNPSSDKNNSYNDSELLPPSPAPAPAPSSDPVGDSSAHITPIASSPSPRSSFQYLAPGSSAPFSGAPPVSSLPYDTPGSSPAPSPSQDSGISSPSRAPSPSQYSGISSPAPAPISTDHLPQTNSVFFPGYL